MVKFKSRIAEWMFKYIIIDKSHDDADTRHDKEFNYFLGIMLLLIVVGLINKGVS